MPNENEENLVDYIAYNIYRADKFNDLEIWQKYIVLNLIPKYTITVNSG